MINDRGPLFVYVTGLHSQASTGSNTINKKVINTCKLLQLLPGALLKLQRIQQVF